MHVYIHVHLFHRSDRIISVSIFLTLYGAGCVFTLLIADFLSDLTGVLNPCIWMAIVTGILTPLTWLGTPKDFWPIAVGALVSTLGVAGIVMVQIRVDVTHGSEFLKNCSAHG